MYPEDSSGAVKGMLFRKESGSKEAYVRHSEVVLPLEAPARSVLDLENGAGCAYYDLRRALPPGGQLESWTALVCVYEGDWRDPAGVRARRCQHDAGRVLPGRTPWLPEGGARTLLRRAVTGGRA